MWDWKLGHVTNKNFSLTHSMYTQSHMTHYGYYHLPHKTTIFPSSCITFIISLCVIFYAFELESKCFYAELILFSSYRQFDFLILILVTDALLFCQYKNWRFYAVEIVKTVIACVLSTICSNHFLISDGLLVITNNQP
jgi:hypothetical protein